MRCFIAARCFFSARPYLAARDAPKPYPANVLSFTPLLRAACATGSLPPEVSTFGQLVEVVDAFGGRALRRARGDASEGSSGVVGSWEDGVVLRAAVARAELLLRQAPPGAAAPHPLVQLPHGIPQPGQLQRTQLRAGQGVWQP